MMRFAEPMESGKAVEAIDRALRHGNFGGRALAARAAALREAIVRLKTSEGAGGDASERAG